MPSGFDLIGEDFRREMATIRQLLAAAGAATAPVRIASSNASMLLLGASYEEFIREVVREYAAALIQGAPPLASLPKEFVSAVWERATHTLRGFKLGRADFDAASARSAMRQLEKFCLDGDRSAALAETVAYNQNNLRPPELNLMFKRVGLPDYCATLGGRQEVIDFFGSPDGPTAHARMVSFIGEFYDTRNEVAHSIGSLKVAGVSNLERYIDFFDCLSEAVICDMNYRILAA